MKLDIKKVKTGSTYYDVEYPNEIRDDKNLQLYGIIKFSEDLIEINSQFPYQEQLKALLHEIIHSINEECCIRDTKEGRVRLFSNVLYDFIMGNPEIFKRIIEYGKKRGR